VFASHFPSDEVQNEAEIRGSTPVSANDWGKNTTPVAVLIFFETGPEGPELED